MLRTAALVMAASTMATVARAQTPETARLTGPVEFTFGTGVLVGDLYGDANVKVDDYVYITDPIGRGLTTAGIAIHLKKYDRTRPSPTLAERFAVLAGGTITPAGGLALGVSWMLVRGVAVNAGVASLLVHRAKDGLGIGAVARPLQSPFETGVSHAWFLGANYTFAR
jgi:hypothetical protein